jgi:hypothetical protein
LPRRRIDQTSEKRKPSKRRSNDPECATLEITEGNDSSDYGGGLEPLEPRIDGFALERQDAEAAFVHSPKRLLAHDPCERFDAERELA